MTVVVVPSETMKAAADGWYVFGASLVVLAAVATSYHTLETNRGRQWIPHVTYWTVAILVLVLLGPTPTAPYFFSSLTVTVVGAALPIYESVRAVCTPEETDDKAWLQYWMFGGVLFMATTWVDKVLTNPKANVYWDGSIIFLFLWLYFPKTDGAVLIFETITEPFVAPRVRPLAAKMNNMISYMYQTMVNAVHLWLVWIVFLFLPKGLKRIISVAIGTIYPLVSSITAGATDDIEDDTYWLTYWSVYGCVFLIMDVL
jgi:hypothetical protein